MVAPVVAPVPVHPASIKATDGGGAGGDGGGGGGGGGGGHLLDDAVAIDVVPTSVVNDAATFVVPAPPHAPVAPIVPSSSFDLAPFTPHQQNQQQQQQYHHHNIQQKPPPAPPQFDEEDDDDEDTAMNLNPPEIYCVLCKDIQIGVMVPCEQCMNNAVSSYMHVSFRVLYCSFFVVFNIRVVLFHRCLVQIVVNNPYQMVTMDLSSTQHKNCETWINLPKCLHPVRCALRKTKMEKKEKRG